MKYVKTKPNFTDKRGEIRDILTHCSVDAITYITCETGAVRGNHYHKKTEQYDFVLEGKIKCVTRDRDGLIKRKTLVPGDLVYHPPFEAHAFEALEKSAFLSMTKGPRNGKDYESDTIRLDKPLIK